MTSRLGTGKSLTFFLVCESSSIPVEADAKHSVVSERCYEEVNVLPTLAKGGQRTLVQGYLPNPVGKNQNNSIAMILISFLVFHAWVPPESRLPVELRRIEGGGYGD